MIKLTKPYFDDREIKAVKETLDSGWVAGQGPKSRELEDFLQNYLGIKYAISVNNCTAGLHLALLAIGIEAGDEVIISDYTFPAAGYAVLYCGGKPRFCDVDLNTYNIDPQSIESMINSNTKALIVIHQFGLMADMEPIMEIAVKHNLKVIEDAACAIGSEYKGQKVGSFGDITTFSFHARKNITSGEGGAVVTNNRQYAELIKSLYSFGMSSAYNRENEFSIPSFSILGYNYKLSDINAAIAVEQLKKYELILKKVCRLAELYNDLLQSNERITFQKVDDDYFNVYQTYAVVLHPDIDRNSLIMKLKQDGIQTTIGTYASHIQPVYKSEDRCPNSLYLYNHSLSLPLYYEMRDTDVEKVVERLLFHING